MADKFPILIECTVLLFLKIGGANLVTFCYWSLFNLSKVFFVYKSLHFYVYFSCVQMM